MNVLVTGRSGVGKSTTIRELGTRGYNVYDTDDMPEVSRLEVKTTGEPTEWPTGFVDWDYYAWRWQEAGLKAILDTDEDVILGAIMSNQKDYYHLFDVVVVLTITAEMMRRRMENRNDHTYGNDARNIERAVERHTLRQADLLIPGTVGVDNSRPTPVVADEIIRIMHDHKRMA